MAFTAKFFFKYLDKSFIEMYLSNFLSAVFILVDLGHMTKMAAMLIYGKNSSKILFSRTSGPIAMKFCM